jgi:hypothetical protein
MIAMMSFIDGRPLFYGAGADAEGRGRNIFVRAPASSAAVCLEIMPDATFYGKRNSVISAPIGGMLAPEFQPAYTPKE